MNEKINGNVWLLLASTAFLVLVFIFMQNLFAMKQEVEIGLSTISNLETLPADAVSAAEVNALLDEIKEREERAMSYLGIFESIGLAITVLGIVGAIVGVSLGMNVRDAQVEFQKTKTEFEDAKQQLTNLENELQAEFQASIKNASITQLLMSMAMQQYELGYLQGAKAIYERALEISPTNPVIPYRIGYILTQTEEFDEAEEIIKSALKIDEKFAHAQAALGFVYRRKGDKSDDKKKQHEYYKLAEKFLLSALNMNSYLVDDDGESWNGALAGLYRRMGREDDAIYHYRQAAYITPESSYPKLNLLLLEWKQERVQNLFAQLEEVERLLFSKIKKDKDTYWDRADLMNIELALGKDSEIIDECLSTFLQVLPIGAKDILPRVISASQFIHDAVSFKGDIRKKEKILEVIDKLKAAQEESEANG